MSFSASASSSVVTAPASPNAPRFFEGKNEKQPIVAERAGALAVVLRADRLRRILDDDELVLLRDGVDLVHRRGLPVQMHGHDRLRVRRDPPRSASGSML